MATGGNADLMAIEAGVSDTGYSAIPETIGARIAALPDVAHASGIIFWALTNIEENQMFILFGYHPQEAAIQHFKVAEGQPLSANRQVLLGRTAAESMNKEVGDTILLGDSAFRVVGIFESGTSWEELGGVVTRRDAQALSGKPRQVTMYAIELYDPNKVDEVMAWMEENLPEIQVSISSEFAESMPDMQTSNSSMGALAVLMALVGSVGMTNTILMSVMERTREIGVLRALGWSRFRILTMIIKEALLLSALSGMVGIVMGIGLAKASEAAPLVGGFLKASFSPELFVKTLIVALLLGTLGGLYPAWRATRLQPLEALRYE
jgi:putative ABC transport system permease protein